jgi:hypothetical protein
MTRCLLQPMAEGLQLIGKGYGLQGARPSVAGEFWHDRRGESTTPERTMPLSVSDRRALLRQVLMQSAAGMLPAHARPGLELPPRSLPNALPGLALWIGVARQGLCFGPSAPARTAMGVGIVCLALLAWPLVVLVLGRPWAQAESFGFLPDPTAVATIGFLLLAPKASWWLLAIPLAAGALGLAMAWGLQAAAA